MGTGMTAAMLAVALMLAPAAAPAAPAETNVVPSKWSLDKARPKAKAAARNKRVVSRRQAIQQAQSKPRIIAGATASNRGNRRKPQAKVGVAVPF
jgi:hypothetical protein